MRVNEFRIYIPAIVKILNCLINFFLSSFFKFLTTLTSVFCSLNGLVCVSPLFVYSQLFIIPDGTSVSPTEGPGPIPKVLF